MATAEFPSNNEHRRKEVESSKAEQPKVAQPKVNRITTAKVSQRKPGLGSRIKETFAGDDAHTVGHYILFEVVIPAAKSTIADSVSQGIERMLFGEVRRRPTGSRTTSGSSYTNYSTRGRAFQPDEPTRTMSRQARATHNFSEIIIDDFGEANQVLDDLQAVIDQYDVASVTTLYDMVGITGNYVDDKWGWSDLRGARVERLGGGGYLLSLPKPVPLD